MTSQHLFKAIPILLTLLLATLPTTTHSAQPNWNIGLATVSITPDQPVWLYGYASKNRFQPYDSILDDIYASAVAIQSEDDEPAVLITADLCVLREPEATALSKVLTAKTGLPRNRILLNWSHTHSGPMLGTSDTNRYPIEDDDREKTEAYTAVLWNKLADLANAALSDMKPARLSYGVGEVNFVKNRRVFHDDGRYKGMAANPDRYVDQTVPVLRIDDPAGQLRGIVFGCACHAVTLGGSSNALSGDFPSYARKHIQKQFPGVETLFVQGCGADANPEPRANADQVEWTRRHGLALGTEVCRVLAGEMDTIRGPLRVQFDSVDLPLKPAPPHEELEQLAKGPFWKSHNAKRILEAQKRNEAIPTHYSTPVALWQFGQDLTLVAIAGEVVSDYVPLVAKTIDANRLWVAGYSNQVFGYLPSARIIEEGGYETLGLVSAHIGWFSPDAQHVLLNAIRRMNKTLPPQ